MHGLKKGPYGMRAQVVGCGEMSEFVFNVDSEALTKLYIHGDSCSFKMDFSGIK